MASSVIELLERISSLPGCAVCLPAPAQSPYKWENQVGMHLPPDLHEFLSRCDGVDLFVNSDYPLYVHGLAKLERANPLIVGEPCRDDRSYDWFVIANDGNGEYLTIDLAPERVGRCYDSYFDRHGIPGSCPVVASTFTDLLWRAVENHGHHWWWLKDEHAPLGDAYDDYVSG